MRNISFKVWLEEQEGDRLQTMLFRRLGFDPKAADDVTIKLRDMDTDRLKDQISNMGFDNETVQMLQTWVDNNPDATLQNLLAQMKGDDLPGEERPTSLPSRPAELPQGQPKPPPQMAAPGPLPPPAV